MSPSQPKYLMRGSAKKLMPANVMRFTERSIGSGDRPDRHSESGWRDDGRLYYRCYFPRGKTLVLNVIYYMTLSMKKGGIIVVHVTD
jgi:hypothetical protein